MLYYHYGFVMGLLIISRVLECSNCFNYFDYLININLIHLTIKSLFIINQSCSSDENH